MSTPLPYPLISYAQSVFTDFSKDTDRIIQAITDPRFIQQLESCSPEEVEKFLVDFGNCALSLGDDASTQISRALSHAITQRSIGTYRLQQISDVLSDVESKYKGGIEQ